MTTETELRNRLEVLLRDTVGPDRIPNREALRDAGVPSNLLANVITSTSRLASDADADQAAAEWAGLITEDRVATESMDPSELARSVPPTN
jgi:hypothetical protein